MKFNMKSLCFMGLITAFFYCCEINALPSVDGYTSSVAHYNCPSGCFCLNGGHTNLFSIMDVEGHQVFIDKCKVSAKTPQSSNYNHTYGKISVAANRSVNKNADYYVDDFSDFYAGEMGFYGTKNGEFVYGYAEANYDMFQCPYTYPNSDQGASSLSQCFKYDMSGNKIYYTSSSSNSNYGNCDIEGVSALVTNLQNALDKANKAAAELQEALNKSNQTNNESSVNHSKPDVENMKTAINAGIVDTKMINKPVKKIRK